MDEKIFLSEEDNERIMQSLEKVAQTIVDIFQPIFDAISEAVEKVITSIFECIVPLLRAWRLCQFRRNSDAARLRRKKKCLKWRYCT